MPNIPRKYERVGNGGLAKCTTCGWTDWVSNFFWECPNVEAHEGHINNGPSGPNTPQGD